MLMQSVLTSARHITGPQLGADVIAGSLDLMGMSTSVARKTEIYGESEPADYFYKTGQRLRPNLADPCRWSPPDRRLLFPRRCLRA